MRSGLLLSTLLTWMVLSAAVPAAALEIPAADLRRLDDAASRYKVVPEMAERVQALVLPYVLDGEVTAGFVLDGISLEKHSITLVLLKGRESVRVHLLPPEVSLRSGTRSRSFALVVEGDSAVAAPLLEAVAANDDGTFWPAAAKAEAASEQARRVAPSSRKVHFTELLGDLLLLVLLVAAVAGAPSFRRAFAGRSLGWWWGLVGVATTALAVRIVAFFALPGGDLTGVWVPSAELPHVSAAWYLGTAGRFATVSLEGVAVLNVVLGALAAVGVYGIASLAMPGVAAPLTAGLVAATFPGHVAVSASISLMVPLVTFAVYALLALMVYVRTREPWAYLFAAALFLFTMFMRPEAIGVAAALLAVPLLGVPWKEWARPSFFGPLAAMVAMMAVRLATLPSAPQFEGEFLSWTVEPGALLGNLRHWWLAPSRVPLVVPVLAVLGLVGRPWREDRALFVALSLWLVVAVAVWFHVDMSQTFRGGRVSLALLPPLALLAGFGTLWLMRLEHPRRGWLVALFIAWLLLAPAIHWKVLALDYKAVFEGNFMLEV